jgi:hypothetical protein
MRAITRECRATSVCQTSARFLHNWPLPPPARHGRGRGRSASGRVAHTINVKATLLRRPVPLEYSIVH